MNRIKYLSVSVVVVAAAVVTSLLAGCKKPVAVEGTTTIPALEGRLLSLRVYSGGDMVALDSSRVIHGRFSFNVPADSVVMASLFLGDESVMPVVLDGGTVTISLGEDENRVSGTALNDSLYAFIRQKREIDAQLSELPHRESQMILEGLDHDEILAQLNSEAAVLGAQSDALVTKFIKAHMNDILGPGVFMIATSSFPYPYLTPQIEEIITLASDEFKANAYVQDFVRMARENAEKESDKSLGE
jgi:hypothetical protein